MAYAMGPGPGGCSSYDKNGREYDGTITSLKISNGTTTVDALHSAASLDVYTDKTYTVALTLHALDTGTAYDNAHYDKVTFSDPAPGSLWFDDNGARLFWQGQCATGIPMYGNTTISTNFGYPAEGNSVYIDSQPVTFETTKSSVNFSINWVNSAVTGAKARLTIITQDANGNSLPGYFTSVYEYRPSTIPALLDTGFSPAAFSLLSGLMYTVQVQDYGGYYFNHWLDTGGADRQRAVSLNSDTTLVAVYSSSPSASPDFTISANPQSVTVPAGTSATTSIKVNETNGYGANLALSTSSSDPGISASLSSSTAIVGPYGGPAMITATISTSPGIAPGTYPLTITASGPYSLSHSVTITITVPPNSSGGSGSSANVIVNSVDSSYNPIAGYYTILYQNGAAVNSGFTPATFSTTSGQSYAIEVQDYGSYHFDHWSDGSASRDRTFTAVYNTGSSGGGSGGSGATSQLSVQTFNSAGSEINGYYVTLWQNGNVIASGFSPAAFSINNNEQYQVAVADYGSESFNHWEGGSTDRMYPVDITGSASTSVVAHAYYSP